MPHDGGFRLQLTSSLNITTCEITTILLKAKGGTLAVHISGAHPGAQHEDAEQS
jgi:hypothetical protein